VSDLFYLALVVSELFYLALVVSDLFLSSFSVSDLFYLALVCPTYFMYHLWLKNTTGMTNLKILALCFHLRPCLVLQYFPKLSHKWRDFWKKFIEHKRCVLLFYKNSGWYIPHSKNNWARYHHKNTVHRSSCTVPVILFSFYSKVSTSFLLYWLQCRAQLDIVFRSIRSNVELSSTPLSVVRVQCRAKLDITFHSTRSNSTRSNVELNSTSLSILPGPMSSQTQHHFP
jgi:hypothetical protein